ncbi:hypothetical protein Salat_0946500 [Sesamum alatum]|uniref:Uncharacterized protein n=1 Tax=Sesamum alatum TaxID=300844 RepID=A0AAE1YKT6_9LAMI|nr:hypothetical protein Salat_0946500 [Sesamum alatum]
MEQRDLNHAMAAKPAVASDQTRRHPGRPAKIRGALKLHYLPLNLPQISRAVWSFSEMEKPIDPGGSDLSNGVQEDPTTPWLLNHRQNTPAGLPRQDTGRVPTCPVFISSEESLEISS